jgi:hypothetical protein
MSYILDFSDWTKKKKNKMLKIDFVRFGLVGSVAFTVNYLFLSLFFRLLKVEIIVSQIFAGEIALLVNFSLHNYWTYKNHEHISFYKKLFNFHLTSLAGQVIILTIEIVAVKLLKIHYGISLIIASSVAMIWNFIWTKYYVFKSKV